MITIRGNINEQLNKVVVQLEKLSPTTEIGSEIVRKVALNQLAEMRHRIQNDAKATDEGPIGQYSEKPIYISLDKSPAASALGRPLGKPINGKRSSVFKSTKRDHTSRYFERGYSQYKSVIQPGLSGVNLTLTGQMMSLLSIFPTNKGWGIGWANSKFTDRARMFEKVKYKKSIFGASPNERRKAIQTAKKLVRNALSKRAG